MKLDKKTGCSICYRWTN